MSDFNFLISDTAAEEFFNSFKEHCKNTGTANKPSFGKESSFLSSALESKDTPKSVLAIDVGGTRTKVCVRNSLPAGFDWQEILDLDNNDLRTQGEGKGLSRMTSELGARIAIACTGKNVALNFDGIAIVWSNKLQCFPLSGEVRGVGAKVFDTANAYRKGEWWNSDIADDDNISDAFLDGLNKASIKSPILVVGNDTIFTAKALIGSNAGVVASTGANSTIVPVGSSIFYNSECAAVISVPYSFFGVINCASDKILKLEDLCAGKGIPHLYKILVAEAYSLGAKELEDINNALAGLELTAKDFGSIAAGRIKEVLGNSNGPTLSDKSVATAVKIAEVLVQNAGTLCAVLILISVANQLDSGAELLVALDSSQARFVPGYKQAVDEYLQRWQTKNKSKIRYELLVPNGQISVPLRGAANSIEEFN